MPNLVEKYGFHVLPSLHISRIPKGKIAKPGTVLCA